MTAADKRRRAQQILDTHVDFREQTAHHIDAMLAFAAECEAAVIDACIDICMQHASVEGIAQKCADDIAKLGGAEMKFNDPWSDYNNDTQLKTLVDFMASLILKAEFTPSEIRKAAMMAAIKVESMTVRPIFIRTDHFQLTPSIKDPQ